MSFYLSKLLWSIFSPYNLVILFFITGLILFFFKYIKSSTLLFSISLLFLIVISIFPIGGYLIHLLEKNYYERKLPKQVDGILILGGTTEPELFKEHSQISVNDSAERLILSGLLIKKYYESKIIFSGGSGIINRPDLIHSEVAKDFYEKYGFNIDKIFFENKSRNTFENILFSKKIANPKNSENWILITSAFHMKRALLVSEKLKWNFIPYAVDYKLKKKFYFIPSSKFLFNLNLFDDGAREWLGLIYYYLTEKTQRIF